MRVVIYFCTKTTYENDEVALETRSRPEVTHKHVIAFQFYLRLGQCPVGVPLNYADPASPVFTRLVLFRNMTDFREV